MFETAAGTWRQQAKLTPNDGDPEDEFGETVALSADGSTAVIGAVQDEHPNGTGDAGAAGSAYVFTNSDGAWRQQAKLAPTDGDAGDWFASSVAVSNDGTTAIIGAVNDDDPNGDHAGSAYVFTQSDGTWRQQAKLAATDGDNSDNFGRSVALSDDGSTALIGTPEDDDPNNGGSAYVFAEATGSWRQQAKLTAQDGDRGDTFGEAVAVSGDGSTALVGARLDEDPNGYRAGSAYVFEQASDSWTQAAKLTADDGDDRDWFGEAVKLSSDGSTALIGAQNDEDPNGSTESYSPGAGSAYVFAVADGSWSQSEKLAAEDGDGDDDFGKAVALAGDGATALIGAPQDENPNGSLAGSAYVFAL